MTEKAGGRKKSGKVRETGSSRSPNAPSEDRKCWQRLELGIQDLKSWGRISSRKVRATGIQTAFQVTKRRDPYDRYHPTFRSFQAAIPGLRDVLPIQLLPATSRVADAYFRAIRRRLTHGRARYNPTYEFRSGLKVPVA